jgi:hypothetical protein
VSPDGPVTKQADDLTNVCVTEAVDEFRARFPIDRKSGEPYSTVLWWTTIARGEIVSFPPGRSVRAVAVVKHPAFTGPAAVENVCCGARVPRPPARVIHRDVKSSDVLFDMNGRGAARRLRYCPGSRTRRRSRGREPRSGRRRTWYPGTGRKRQRDRCSQHPRRRSRAARMPHRNAAPQIAETKKSDSATRDNARFED